MYARSLSRIALAFVVMYLAMVVSTAIPVRLLDYLWINRVSATLINGSSMPLLALLVVVLGSILFPEDEILQKRRQLFCRLATPAALGFLLLAPLNAYSGMIQQLNGLDQLRSLAGAERQLTAYRNAVSAAASTQALQADLAKLGAPKLDPGALALPLPDLQARLGQTFAQAGAQIAERRQVLSESTDWKTWLRDILKIVISSLALAFGFAAFAQPSAHAPPLLDTLEARLTEFRRQSIHRQWGGTQTSWLTSRRGKPDMRGIPDSEPEDTFSDYLAGSPQPRAQPIVHRISPLQRLLSSLKPSFGRNRKRRSLNIADEDYFQALADDDDSSKRS